MNKKMTKEEFFQEVKEHLFIRVCNAERNKDILDNAPHKCIEDLAITYHLMLKDDGESLECTLITNQLMENCGVTAEQLHEDAIANSQKLLSPALHDTADVLFEPFGQKATNLLESDTDIQDATMLVLTNSNRVLGAGALFYPELLHRIAKIIGGSFYILPSSIHETIILKEDEEDDVEHLKQMVTSVNEEYVEPAERLSDQVYHYDSETRVFETAEHYEIRRRAS